VNFFHKLSKDVGDANFAVAYDEEEFSLLRVSTIDAKNDIVFKAVCCSMVRKT
jgi:hypothetical protein